MIRKLYFFLFVLACSLSPMPVAAQQVTVIGTCAASTSTVLGCVKPDGTTITNSAGAISTTYGTGATTAAQGNDTRITGAAQYATGTWTPTTNLVIVPGTGAITVAGEYTKITNIAGTPGTWVLWTITIRGTGTATSASTFTSTNFQGFPIAPLYPSAGFSSGTGGAIGSLDGQGLLDTGTGGTFYTPTWAATTAAITLNGQYFAN